MLQEILQDQLQDRPLQDHEVDKLLGLNPHAIIDFERQNQCDPEFTLSSRARDSWIGLDANTLNTSYQDLFDLLTTLSSTLSLAPGTRIIDLGSGFGRLGLVIGLGFPNLNFTGIECWSHRLQPALEIAKKMQMTHVHFEHGDLLDPNYQIPEAEIYFSYLTSSDPMSLQKILEKLILSHQQKNNTVAKGFALIARKVRPELMAKLAPSLELVGTIGAFFHYRLPARVSSALSSHKL